MKPLLFSDACFDRFAVVTAELNEFVEDTLIPTWNFQLHRLCHDEQLIARQLLIPGKLGKHHLERAVRVDNGGGLIVADVGAAMTIMFVVVHSEICFPSCVKLLATAML